MLRGDFKKWVQNVLPAVYDESLSYQDLLYKVIHYLDSTMNEVDRVNTDFINLKKFAEDTKKYCNEYFENLDVQNEINNKLDEMVLDGTLDTLINRYILNMPRGNELNLQRIGRKLFFGENPESYNYNSNGKACTLQGGCMLDENTVAYMLWDSENTNLNKNTIVIMNINTGTIQRQEDFVFGWCNSLTYDDNNIYVALRGTTTTNDVSSNNGIIKIINPISLEVINELNLQINVNAISIYDEKIYALEENTNKIKLFTLEGEPLNQTINLKVNINNLYNQDIKITKDYIYIISTKPNNLLNVYDLNGNNVESYSIKPYGGMYFVGELQFIDSLKNNDMILGSVKVNYNEHNNQFFKFNLVNNISNNDIITNVGQTLYCNSNIDNYNPDGSQLNPFTTINEVDNTNVKSIVCNANNKEYNYTYLSNHHVFRLENAILDKGIHLQYGDYYINNCTIKRALDTNVNACIFFRYTNIFFNNTTFDASNCDYCFYPNGNNIIKFATSLFLNYNVEVCRTNAPGCIIDINNLYNIPYIPRIKNHDYEMTPNSLTAWKPGVYEFTSNLDENEIETIINNCSKIVIKYEPLNTASIKTVIFNKSSNNEYTIVDSTVSSSAVNVRIAKMIFKVTKLGLEITSSNVTKIIYENSATYNLIQANDSSNRSDFITIKNIYFRN